MVFFQWYIQYRFSGLGSSVLTSPGPALVKNFMLQWYMETTALVLLRVGRPMITELDHHKRNHEGLGSWLITESHGEVATPTGVITSLVKSF
ncbi:hypothetical protein B296_00004393 [Ensete ventricosum]|uniref:Uncharacterized protein n=1 Tax=Ensete ventricosum TaxID=4639 RepID=A0A427ATN8_ENSVE|nr:hypothetical protein B296_00004393 [Ensete ventricosum]